jgi:hypothetical protein
MLAPTLIQSASRAALRTLSESESAGGIPVSMTRYNSITTQTLTPLIPSAHGLGFVFGAQAGLFAGRAVLHVEHFAAPEQGVFCFHLDYLFRYSSPVSTAFVNASGGEVSASLEQ